MSWTKAKNIIILILVAANGLLCILAVPLWQRQHSETERLSRQLSTLFADQGLELDAALPQTQTFYGLELTHGTGAAATAVTALLGDSVLVQTDSGRYQSVYTGPKGSCTFSLSGSFSAQLDGMSPVGTAKDHAVALLEAMGFISAAMDTAAQTDTVTVTARQSLLGAPIFGPGLTLTYQSGVLQSVEGMFYVTDELPIQVSETPGISGADALLAFLNGRDALGWVGSRVSGLEQGWLETETPSAARVLLTPVWRITTDTAVVYVDALDGTVEEAA